MPEKQYQKNQENNRKNQLKARKNYFFKKRPKNPGEGRKPLLRLLVCRGWTGRDSALLVALSLHLF
jgi:hypothetical protein